MAKTKNKYSYPIEEKDIVRITYDESPAHVKGTPMCPHLHFMIYYYEAESDYQTKEIVWA